MIRFELDIDINRPAQEVFTYLADFTNIPSWNYYVADVRQLTPGPVVVGTIYEQIRRSDQQRYRVSAYEPPHAVAVTTLPGETPAFHRHIALQPRSDGGTHVHDRWDLDTGHPGFVQRVAASRIKSGVEANLALLRQLLEQGQVRLQDGRMVTLDADRRRTP